MRTLQHFNNFVKEITASNSRLHKQAVLQKYKDDEVVKRYLQIAFDPYRVYGLSTKKLHTNVPPHVAADIELFSIFELFEYLEEQLDNTGCDHTLHHTERWLKNNISQDMIQKAITEITDMGGYCDCEVLLNCYEDYDIG
jgi:hypothetical protein